MAERRITFCSGGPDPERRRAASAWLASVLAQWPGDDLPGVDGVTLEQLLDRLSDPELDPRASGLGACVLMLLDSEIPHAAAARACDLLQGAAAPVIVVSSEAELLRPLLQNHGTIVLDGRVSPRDAALMAFALAERQPFVDSILRDLRAGQGASRGMRGEMVRLHEELHLASTVQREMLPTALPDSDDLHFATLYQPATYVSGDLYDVRRIDEHRVAFFIADAVGHGVPAALITMMLSRGILNQIALCGSGPIRPSACISGLNRELCEHASGSHRFATAVLGIIDQRDFTVRLAGAGHPPSILLSGGKMRMIESGGPLLGVFAEAEYPEDDFILAPGDTLAVYTDGFELAFPGEIGPGEANVGPTGRPASRVAPREYLRHMGVLDSEQVECVREGMDSLARLLAAQEGSLHQRDDVTALAVRRVRRAESARLAA